MLQCAGSADLNSGPSGQRRMWMGHTPVVTPARCLLGLSKHRAQHDGISTGSDGFADISPPAEAAVSNYRHVSARLFEVLVSRRRTIHGRRYLGHTNAQYLPGSTSGTRSDTNQDPAYPGVHQLQAGTIADAVPDDNGKGYRLAKLRKDEPTGAFGDMPG